MSDQNPPPYEMFLPSQNQESDGKWQTGNYNPRRSAECVGPTTPPPNLSAISLQEANQTAALYSNILNDLSSALVEAPPPSLPFEQQPNWITGSRVHEAASARYSSNYTLMSGGDLSSTISPPPPLLLLRQTNELIPFPGENILSHGCSADNRQSSSAGTKRKQEAASASDYMDMQKEEKSEFIREDGAKEESKQLKRTHNCAQVHNLNNRLRRQKFKEKLKVLQELVPKCNKRDKEATLDDAIEYIKILQNQVQEKQQTGSTGFPVAVFPWMMPPPQPGMQIPTLPQFLHTFPGMGMPYPMGLSNPWASGLPNPGNVMEPWIGSQFTTQGENTSPTENVHNKPS